MPQVMEAQAMQAGFVTQRPPRGVPVQHRLRGVETAPLTRGPEVVLRPRVAEQIRALEHARNGFDGRRVERDNPVARLRSCSAERARAS